MRTPGASASGYEMFKGSLTFVVDELEALGPNPTMQCFESAKDIEAGTAIAILLRSGSRIR
jgi:hypothetical protein